MAPSSPRLAHLLVPLGVALMLAVGLLLHPASHGDRVELTLFGLTLPATCWFYRFTGLPCAGCGLTRSVVLLVHGRFGSALAMHPFGPIVVAMALLQLPPRLALASGRDGAWIGRWDRTWNRGALVGVVLLFGWWIVRTAPALLTAYTALGRG